jgi:hypothetical protein
MSKYRDEIIKHSIDSFGLRGSKLPESVDKKLMEESSLDHLGRFGDSKDEPQVKKDIPRYKSIVDEIVSNKGDILNPEQVKGGDPLDVNKMKGKDGFNTSKSLSSQANDLLQRWFSEAENDDIVTLDDIIEEEKRTKENLGILDEEESISSNQTGGNNSAANLNGTTSNISSNSGYNNNPGKKKDADEAMIADKNEKGDFASAEGKPEGAGKKMKDGDSVQFDDTDIKRDSNTPIKGKESGSLKESKLDEDELDKELNELIQEDDEDDELINMLKEEADEIFNLDNNTSKTSIDELYENTQEYKNKTIEENMDKQIDKLFDLSENENIAEENKKNIKINEESYLESLDSEIDAIFESEDSDEDEDESDDDKDEDKTEKKDDKDEDKTEKKDDKDEDKTEKKDDKDEDESDDKEVEEGTKRGTPDGTGPYGKGKGPGKGKADGSGLKENESLEEEKANNFESKAQQQKPKTSKDIYRLESEEAELDIIKELYEEDEELANFILNEDDE